jgi:hypothetical protein
MWRSERCKALAMVPKEASRASEWPRLSPTMGRTLMRRAVDELSQDDRTEEPCGLRCPWFELEWWILVAEQQVVGLNTQRPAKDVEDESSHPLGPPPSEEHCEEGDHT